MELEMINCTKAKENQFKTKNIESVEDLVEYLPRKYYDFRYPKLVTETSDQEMCAIVVSVYSVNLVDSANKKIKMVKIKGYDDEHNALYITFFNQPYIAREIMPGAKYLFAGKMSISNGFHSFVNPIIHTQNIAINKRLHPIYSQIKGMSDNYLKEKISMALKALTFEDYLPNELVNKYKLCSIRDSRVMIHSPNSPEDVKEAKKRLLFDDLFLYNYLLERNRDKLGEFSKYKVLSLQNTNKYINNLPFTLTEGQSNAIKSMINKTREGKKINALVQGDVGAGKTEVCKAMMLCAFDNGWQSVVMAPTQILAQQHYNDVKKSFEGFVAKFKKEDGTIEEHELNVAFLHSKLKKREKTKILKGIADGSIHMIVGTHSVISDDVVYKNLGLITVDEEHRFGVKQREKLESKSSRDVHCIRMSATPIPRTLATSIYGDTIGVLTIKTMPKGRKPIITKEIENAEEGYNLIRQQVAQGHQAYIVCPLIEESENEKMADVESIESAEREARANLKGLKIGVINGKMKEDEVQEEVKKFLNKEYDVIISTTIIEVGVNVPNATVIMIKSSERFGLAQMHQLRGRVGRSSLQSYCLLLANVKTDEGREKIDAMVNTTDGFKIAEEDLRIRGAGDFVGTAQSGFNKYVMLMMAYPKLNALIKEDIKKIYKDKNLVLNYDKKLNIEQYDY